MQNLPGRQKTVTYAHVGPLTVLFAALLGICVILERVGVDIAVIKTILVFFSGATVIAIGLSSGTMQPSRYFATGRSLSPGVNAMATASIWMSGSVLLALPGYFGLAPQAALAFAAASLAGLVVLGMTIGPAFNASGAYALGDYMRIRFSSTAARAVSALLAIGVCFALLVPQLAIMAFFIDQLLPVGSYTAIIFAIVPVGLAIWLGGMVGANRTEALIYVLALAGFAAPLVYFLFSSGSKPAIETLSVLDPVSFFHAGTLFTGGDLPPVPGAGWRKILVMAFLCIAAIASLPHLLGTFATLQERRAARGAGIRTSLLVLIPLLAVPFHAAFAQILVFDTLSGLSAGEIGRVAGWIFALSQTPFGPLVSICGEPAVNAAGVVAACGGAAHKIIASDLAINAAIVPMAMTVRDDLPLLFGGVFSLGILLAAASTAIALTQSIATSIAHDLFRGVIAPGGPAGPRLAVARMSVIAACLAGGYVAYRYPQAGLRIIFWIGGLCAATFFPVLQLSLFWKRMTGAGAIAGMVSGLAASLFGLVIKIWGAGIIPAEGIGALPDFLAYVEHSDVANIILTGMAVSLLCTVLGTLFSSAPRQPLAGLTKVRQMYRSIPAGNHEDYS